MFSCISIPYIKIICWFFPLFTLAKYRKISYINSFSLSGYHFLSFSTSFSWVRLFNCSAIILSLEVDHSLNLPFLYWSRREGSAIQFLSPRKSYSFSFFLSIFPTMHVLITTPLFLLIERIKFNVSCLSDESQLHFRVLLMMAVCHQLWQERLSQLRLLPSKQVRGWHLFSGKSL